MTSDEITEIITNESDNLIYVADVENYNLLFLNRKIMEAFGLSGPEDYHGKKCYDILQGKDSPCDYCTNKLLKKDSFYTWENYNRFLDRYYILSDKLIEIDGRDARLEIASDITEKELFSKAIKHRLDTEKILVECIHSLAAEKDIKSAVEGLLKIILEYYCADRSYIFEFNLDNGTLSNTYEYCVKGIDKEISNLQKLPIELVDTWVSQFKKKGEFFITSLDKNLNHDSDEYKILEQQNIESLIVAPMYTGGVISGFIGVDNPTVNTDDTSLLKSVTFFICEDIAKRVMMDRLQRISFIDSLTGIRNRNCYIELLEELQKDSPDMLGILYIDINGLKLANDKHGHEYGDNLIKNVAEALICFFGENVYRIGGDEFVVLCADMQENEFEDLSAKFRDYVSHNELLNISIGAIWKNNNIDIKNQVIYADKLMYVEKQKYYSSMDNEDDSHTSVITKKLKREIDEGQFLVYLQPKIQVTTNKIIGAEAIIRKLEDGMIILPSRFIHLYEKEGVIRNIDLFVFEAICGILKKWEYKKIPLIQISVNISRVTLMEHDIVDILFGICTKHGVSPQNIKLEIKENINSIDLEQLRNLTKKLNDIGISISLDDISSDHSCLPIMSIANFNELKFEKSRTESITNNSKFHIIVEHVIDICKEINLISTVAEDVETKEQYDLLKEFKCDIAQGYFISRPVPVVEFERKYLYENESDASFAWKDVGNEI